MALIMTDTEEREKSSSVLVVSVKWILSNTGTLFCNNVIIYIFTKYRKRRMASFVL